jgi:ubiquinone/menaquinone biosynthesis C-methylase UbiE
VDDDVQARITGFWSRVAGGYEAHGGNVPAAGTGEYDAWVRVIGELLPPAPADVLDVGTGTGFVATIAAGLGYRVTATDLAEPMLAEARRSGSAEVRRSGFAVRFVRGDAVAPAFAPASFDAVVSRHLFWTLRDPAAALAAWRRLVRPGGRVVVIDGFWFPPDSPSDGLFSSYYNEATRGCLPGWRYSGTEPIADLFVAAGFSSVTVRSLLPLYPEMPAASAYAITGVTTVAPPSGE